MSPTAEDRVPRTTTLLSLANSILVHMSSSQEQKIKKGLDQAPNSGKAVFIRIVPKNTASCLKCSNIEHDIPSFLQTSLTHSCIPVFVSKGIPTVTS